MAGLWEQCAAQDGATHQGMDTGQAHPAVGVVVLYVLSVQRHACETTVRAERANLSVATGAVAAHILTQRPQLRLIITNKRGHGGVVIRATRGLGLAGQKGAHEDSEDSEARGLHLDSFLSIVSGSVTRLNSLGWWGSSSFITTFLGHALAARRGKLACDFSCFLFWSVPAQQDSSQSDAIGVRSQPVQALWGRISVPSVA